LESGRRIGLAVTSGNTRELLESIQEAEKMGIQAAWLTTSGARQDNLTVCAVAAAQTDRILLGTSITPTWPRHPVVMVQQVRVVADLAPGRFRLGVGTSHKDGIEGVFGLDYNAPLPHLRDYLRILKALLQQGKVDYDGKYYQAHVETGVKLDVPVMAAALRRRSFELCGEEADGAISWVCPRIYLDRMAVPALRAGARRASRNVPPLIAHAPICVHENPREVMAAMRKQMSVYPSLTNYAQMFADAGFSEVIDTKAWSDAMIDAVALYGDESKVMKQLQEIFDYGAAEIILSPVTAGREESASYERTMRLVAEASRTMGREAQ